MKSTTTIITVGIICLVVGAAGGYFGRGLITPASRFGTRQAGQGGQFRAGMFGGQGGRPVVGTIQTVNNNNLTLKSADGSSHVVILTSDTKYNKITAGSASDFPAGTQVIITGQEAADGTVTASAVQAAPMRPSTMPSTTP